MTCPPAPLACRRERAVATATARRSERTEGSATRRSGALALVHLLVLPAVPVLGPILEALAALLGPRSVPRAVIVTPSARAPEGPAEQEDRPEEEQREQEEPEGEEPPAVPVPADDLDHLVRGGGPVDPLVHPGVVGADRDPDHRQDHQDRRRDRPSASHVVASFRRVPFEGHPARRV